MLLTLPMKKKNGNEFSFVAHTFKMNTICIKLQNISCLICCLFKADLLPANGIFRIVMSTKCFKYFSLWFIFQMQISCIDARAQIEVDVKHKNK